MSDLLGTTVATAVDRVVDGDTVAVTINDREEKLRLSNLDTEESNHGSDKPVTPWGKKAKERATELLPAGAPVTLEFAGSAKLHVPASNIRSRSPLIPGVTCAVARLLFRFSNVAPPLAVR